MLLIYLPENSPRAQYIFKAIFFHFLGIEYETTGNIELFKNHNGEKVNYSDERINDEFFIKVATLLQQNSIADTEIKIVEMYDCKVLFPNDKTCDLGFDIFSSTFYLLTRYEEYLPYVADKYGRYKAEDSLAFKNNFLQLPIVDIWMEQFRNILQKKFPELKFKASKFEAIITYDIDVAYKFKGRSLVRNTGSITKDLLKFDFKNILNRFQTFNNKCKDPWDTYEYLHDIINENKLSAIFFFLLGDSSANDRNLHYENTAMKELINKVKIFSEIGIHPSFKTSLFIEKFLIEKQRLENLADKKINKSRQHFLKFTLPETYNALIKAGITEDYSMGFSSKAGFRAGTSKPYYFYDLKNEKATFLKIFPITFMEHNFMNTSHPDTNQILSDIFNLIGKVKKVDGTFISIWHNHTVSDTNEYKEWRHIHDQMIQKIIASIDS